MRSSLVVSERDNAPLQRLKATQLFKTLSDPTRLQILYILAQNQGTNICAIELSDALKVSPPTVTHHMKKLMDTNLVTRHKTGKWAYYKLVPDTFRRVHRLIDSL